MNFRFSILNNKMTEAVVEQFKKVKTKFFPMDNSIKNLTLKEYEKVRNITAVIFLILIQILYILWSKLQILIGESFPLYDLIEFVAGIILSGIVYTCIYKFVRWINEKNWIRKNLNKSYISGNWCHYYSRSGDNTDNYVRGGWIEVSQNYYDLQVEGHNFNIYKRNNELIIDPSISSTWNFNTSYLDKNGNVIGCFRKDTKNVLPGEEISPENSCNGIITFSRPISEGNEFPRIIKGTTSDTGKSTVFGDMYLFRTPRMISNYSKVLNNVAPEWEEAVNVQFNNKIKLKEYSYYAVVTKNENERYLLTIPDLNNVTYSSYNFHKVIENGAEVGCKEVIDRLLNCNEIIDYSVIPKASSLEKIREKTQNNSNAQIILLNLDLADYVNRHHIDFSKLKNLNHLDLNFDYEESEDNKVEDSNFKEKKALKAIVEFKEKTKKVLSSMKNNGFSFNSMNDSIKNLTLSIYQDISNWTVSVFLFFLQLFYLFWDDETYNLFSFYFNPRSPLEYFLSFIASFAFYVLISIIVHYLMQRNWISQNKQKSYISGDWFHFYTRNDDNKRDFVRGGWIEIRQNYYDISVTGHNFDINFDNEQLYIKKDPARSNWHFLTSHLNELGNVVGAFQKLTEKANKDKKNSAEINCSGVITFNGRAHNKDGEIKQIYGKTEDAGASEVSGGLTLFKSDSPIKISDNYNDIIQQAPDLWKEEIKKQFENKLRIGKIYYYGVYHVRPDGVVEIVIPDLNNTLGYGHTIKDAILDVKYQASEKFIELLFTYLENPDLMKEKNENNIVHSKIRFNKNEHIVLLGINVDSYIKDQEIKFINYKRTDIEKCIAYILKKKANH